MKVKAETSKKLISLLALTILSCSGITKTQIGLSNQAGKNTDLIYMLSEVKLLLEKAEQNVVDQNYEPAISVLKDGISLLGNSYLTPEVIDDSGQKLVLAQTEEKNGNYIVAANLFKNVLATRLSIMKSKAGGAK